MRAAIIVVLALLASAALARDDGRYAQSHLKKWFDSLHSKNGMLCCSDADGEETEFDIRDGAYWAPIDGIWQRVPDEAVITEPNRFGRAMKWLYLVGGQKTFRCFIPGGGV